MFEVPADADWNICSCKKRQYWIRSKNGLRMSVDCDVAGGERPDKATGKKGRGVAHFATCPKASHFRRSRKGAR